ncbi:MAG: NifU family protein [Bacilli bacterium]|nr:NifU family protein [Bacilli bacterium]
MKIEEKIKKTLNKIRPFLRKDGGDVEFIEFKKGVVYINVLGACKNCIFLNNTNNEIKVLLMSEIKEAQDVIII